MVNDIQQSGTSSLDETQLLENDDIVIADGTVLAGRFQIQQLIGHGAFGYVYKAVDLHLNSAIAIKVLHQKLASEHNLLEQFKNEILILRQLSHRNIVRVHEYYEDDNRYFITMDWLDGQLLSDKIKEQNLDVETIQSYCQQIIAALQYVQQFDVCHRDLKPDNILIGHNDCLYIFDFGLAVFGEQSSRQSYGGTPYYCTPEYLLHNEVNETTDFYSLGILLYEMCCGQLPYQANDVSNLITEKQNTITKFPVSHQDFKVFKPMVERLTIPILRKRADKLGKTIDSFNSDLSSPPAQSKSGWFLLILIMSVVGILLFYGWNQSQNKNSAYEQLVSLVLLPFDSKEDRTFRWVAESATDVLSNQLNSQARIRLVPVERSQQIMQSMGYQTPLAATQMSVMAELLGAEYFVQGRYLVVGKNQLQLKIDLVHMVGTVENRNTLFDDVVSDQIVYQTLIEVANKLFNQFSLDEPIEEVYQLSKSDLSRLAIINSLDPITENEKVSSLLKEFLSNRPNYIPAWEHLYEVCLLTEQIDAAEQALIEIIQLTQPNQFNHRLAKARLSDLTGAGDEAGVLYETLLNEQPGDEDLIFEVAKFNIRTENLQAAKSNLEKLVSLSPNRIEALFELAKVSIWLGDTQQAIDDYLVRSLISANKLNDEAFKGTIYNAFGVAYQRIGDVDLAIENYNSALKIREKLGDSQGVFTSMSNLSTMFAIKGDYEKAEELLTEGASLLDELGDELSRSKIINKLGVLAEEQGMYKEALTHYQNALSLRMSLDEKWLQAESMNNVGFMFFLLSQLDHAVIYWQQAEKIYQELGDPVGLVQVKQNLAQLQLNKGEIKEAFKLLESSLQQANELELIIEGVVAKANMAKIAFIQGNFSFGIDELEQVLEVLEARKDIRGLTEYRLWLAEWYQEIGDIQSAKIQLDKLSGIDVDSMSLAQQQLVKVLTAIVENKPLEALFEAINQLHGLSDYEKIHLYLLGAESTVMNSREAALKILTSLSQFNVKLYKIDYLRLLEFRLKYLGLNRDWKGFKSYLTEANQLVRGLPTYWRNYHFNVLQNINANQNGQLDQSLEEIMIQGWSDLIEQVPMETRAQFTETQQRVYRDMYE